MRCRQAERLLSDRLDQRLSPAQETALEAHVQACPRCAQFARSLNAGVDALGGLPSVPPNPDVRQAVQAGVFAAPESHVMSGSGLRQLAGVLAASLVVAVVAGLMIVVLEGRGGSPQTPHIAYDPTSTVTPAPSQSVQAQTPGPAPAPTREARPVGIGELQVHDYTMQVVAPLPHPGRIAAVNHDGTRFVIEQREGDGPPTLWAHDTASGESRKIDLGTAPVFSPDGERVLFQGPNRSGKLATLTVYEWNDGDIWHATDRGSNSVYTPVGFTESKFEVVYLAHDSGAEGAAYSIVRLRLQSEGPGTTLVSFEGSRGAFPTPVLDDQAQAVVYADPDGEMLTWKWVWVEGGDPRTIGSVPSASLNPQGRVSAVPWADSGYGVSYVGRTTVYHEAPMVIVLAPGADPKAIAEIGGDQRSYAWQDGDFVAVPSVPGGIDVWDKAGNHVGQLSEPYVASTGKETLSVVDWSHGERPRLFWASGPEPEVLTEISSVVVDARGGKTPPMPDPDNMPKCKPGQVRASQPDGVQAAGRIIVSVPLELVGGPCRVETQSALTVTDADGNALPLNTQGVTVPVEGALIGDDPAVQFIWANWCGVGEEFTIIFEGFGESVTGPLPFGPECTGSTNPSIVHGPFLADATVSSTVVSVSASARAVEVQPSHGDVTTIALTADTIMWDGDGQRVGLEAVRPGDQIVAAGEGGNGSFMRAFWIIVSHPRG